MRGRAGFWDIEEYYLRASHAGDPLPQLTAVVFKQIGGANRH
jgi:hypothetical protein